MAKRTLTHKTARKTVRAAAGKPRAKAKAATKTVGRRKRSPSPKDGSSPAASTPGSRADASTGGSIRVRMYRVGFGDFFLLTVPGKNDRAHILIDCGVHAANIHSMDDCVQDMKKETGNRLALVILTHYHADHMSGFASNYDDFAEFEVGAVWITNRLDPANGKHAGFMAQLNAVARQLQLQLGARTDAAAIEAQHKVENALGVDGSSGRSNAKALQLLQSGFKNKPPVYYYQGGDVPTLPDELKGMIAAEVLSPSPKDSAGEFAASDNKTEQYLAAMGDSGVPDATHIRPFDVKKWKSSTADYPPETFDEFDSGILGRDRTRKRDGSSQMQTTLGAMQPDVLAAAADKLDGTLNNQSLVVLFTCHGKKLLFVGDAQWGNWAHWLYGKAVTGADPGITDRAKDILGSIDFYKVGHHGSTNATPIPVVGALNKACASMCSTATGAYGTPAKKTEVPRTALMDALESQTRNQLVRSDWVAAGNAKADKQAHDELPTLPSGFSTPGALYIDYSL